MILALIPKPSSVETLLNNLQEADFDLASVSVILRDQQLRNQIAQDAGPLKGVVPSGLVKKLIALGLSKPDAQAYADGVTKGQALVAMTSPQESQAAAIEMFKDYDPQLLKVLG